MEIRTLQDLPLIKPGDNLGELILQAAQKQGSRLESGDVLVVAQSVVSKSEGRVVDLRGVKPSLRAQEIAKRVGKDPREVEVILQQSKEIVRLSHVLIARTEQGFICANAGVDHSNVEPEHVTILPKDPDSSAKRIRETIKRVTGAEVTVIISDTQGRPHRRGVLGFAIGVAGIKPFLDLRGKQDLYGNELKVTVAAVADALAAAAVAVMGEAGEGTPVVVIKGAKYERGQASAREIVRPREKDLFL